MGIVIGHGRRIVIRLPQVPLPEGERSWPLDARLALFVLEAQADEATTGASGQYQYGSGSSFDAPPSHHLQQQQQQPRPQPRRDERVACRIAADLLFASATSSASAASAASNESDLPPECDSAAAYVRDVSPGHAGFICRAPALHPGQTCWLRLEQADGSTVTLRGIVGRCRAFMEGWSEGVIRFALEPAEAAAAQEQPLRVAV